MIEVLKQALAAAKLNERHQTIAESYYWLRQYKLLAEKAIAELESQEPVALPCCGYTDASAVKWNPLNGVVQCHNCGQNYTTPPQRTWVGLTRDEQSFVYQTLHNATSRIDSFWVDFANAIEAKLKEKNT